MVAKPLAPIITPPGESSICSPNTISISADCQGNELLWSNGSTLETILLSNVGTYSLSGNCTTLAGCTSEESLIQVLEIKEVPATPLVSPLTSNSVCAPNDISLTASCLGGSTVKWSDGTTGSSKVLSGVGVYSISASCVLNNCESTASEAITYEIKAGPIVTLSSNSPVCAGATLNINGSLGAAYLWSGPNSFSSTSQNIDFVNASISQSGNYSFTVTENGCSATATIAVVVNPSPMINVTADPATVEAGESSSLTLTGCDDGIINWAINNSTTNPLVTAVFNTTTFTVSCTQNLCTSVASVSVSVTENPCPELLELISITDDLNNETISKYASDVNGVIKANNKISGTARVDYKAKSIELNVGFKAESGTVFLAEIGGCN